MSTPLWITSAAAAILSLLCGLLLWRLWQQAVHERAHVLGRETELSRLRTLLQRAERQLLHARALNTSLLDHAPYCVIATDRRGRITHANAATEQLLGWRTSELTGRIAAQALHLPGEIAERARVLSLELGQAVPPDQRVLSAKAVRGLRDDGEWTFVRKDGTHVPVHLSLIALRSDDGQVSGFVGVAYDISERKRAQAHIVQLAHYDSLTGLPNRVLLHDRMKVALTRARRAHGHMAVMLLDLDHFKRINDTLGHAAGDEVLRVVAMRLQAALRACDTVARMGGDEFVVLLSDLAGRDEAEGVAMKLVQSFHTPLEVGDRQLVITPSVGLALYPEDGHDLATLLQSADIAMYAAKARGRSQWAGFSAEMKRATQDRVELEAALRQAIMARQLELHYQPMVRLDNGSVIRLEALLRWTHPKRGVVSPAEFVPLAEDSGLILPLGEWVLQRACEDVARLRSLTGLDLQVAVNLSPHQVRQGRLVHQVDAVLAATGLPGRALELEITEGVLMEDAKAAIDTLEQLRMRGVRIAIDDFGTGYSSLSYLARFPLDAIKLDRSFVHDLQVDDNAAIATSVLAMGRSLKLEVVAEGVETEAQRHFLQQRGCDLAQGFLFSRAQPLDDMAGWLAARAPAAERQPLHFEI